MKHALKVEITDRQFFSFTTPKVFDFKGRTHDWIALFSWSNLSKTPFRYSNETYRVCRTFDEFLDSRKIFEKSSHGPKLSKKCHEKVVQAQAKRFLVLKTRLISQSGNYLKPLELNFQIRPWVRSKVASNVSNLFKSSALHPKRHWHRLLHNWHQLLVCPITPDWEPYLKI